MSNLQTYYHFKLDFQKVDQHTGGKWLIHGTKHCKDNQLQSHFSQKYSQKASHSSPIGVRYVVPFVVSPLIDTLFSSSDNVCKYVDTLDCIITALDYLRNAWFMRHTGFMLINTLQH